MMHTKLLEIRMDVLSRNKTLAAGLRQRFKEAGVFTLNLVSGPGAGKTSLLEQSLHALKGGGYGLATLVGDLATDNDARRLADAGSPVRQIETSGDCHLESHMIEKFLEGWDLTDFSFLFIENVGNLVCPANYDLGEALRVVLLSTPEGEDKPLKYPPMFRSADVALITKTDLADVLGYDLVAARENLRQINPEIIILEISSRTGEGMSDWLALLIKRRGAWLRSLQP